VPVTTANERAWLLSNDITRITAIGSQASTDLSRVLAIVEVARHKPSSVGVARVERDGQKAGQDEGLSSSQSYHLERMLGYILLIGGPIN
jgi:hypothetical protein